jgi:alpha-ketoglutarate-dependent taurine dioxygenase
LCLVRHQVLTASRTPDTLWASGYEIYDRISPPYQRFLESLTATFAQPGFIATAERSGFSLYSKVRGAPENVGTDLIAVHPVVRTNPVTGWKSVYPVGGHVSHIDGLAEAESKALLKWFVTLLVENHDLQVRFRWQNKNDLGKYGRWPATDRPAFCAAVLCPRVRG